MNCIYSHEGGAYCDKHDHGAVTVGCCGEENCPDREVLTNADCIRAMSDEELAFWMTTNVTCCSCPADLDACHNMEFPEKMTCEEIILDWLKNPVEVDNG